MRIHANGTSTTQVTSAKGEAKELKNKPASSEKLRQFGALTASVGTKEKLSRALLHFLETPSNSEFPNNNKSAFKEVGVMGYSQNSFREKSPVLASFLANL
jgi:hypothetical protein